MPNNPNAAANLKPFTKNDKRINRKGRPKSFDKLRELAQSIGDEPATIGDKPVVIGAQVVIEAGEVVVVGGHIATQAEMMLRDMLHNNPERFQEIGYGKVPQPLEVAGKDGGAITLALVKGYTIVSPDDFPALDATESKPE